MFFVHPCCCSTVLNTWFSLACKNTDIATFSVCMYSSEGPTDIYSNSGGNLLDVSDLCSSFGATLLEQRSPYLVMEHQGCDKDICILEQIIVA